MKEQLLTWTLEGKRSVDGGLRVVESLVSGRENRDLEPGLDGLGCLRSAQSGTFRHCG